MNRWRGHIAWVWRQCRVCGVWFDCIEGMPAAQDSICLRHAIR